MRSDLMKEGAARAPHRSLLYALGLTENEMKRPFIAVVNSASDYIPGHRHLKDISEAVKAGIRNAGGVPFEFNTIGVCDGLSMNHKGMKYSLCSRELIADSIEVMLTAHPLDAVVFIPNCDNRILQQPFRIGNGLLQFRIVHGPDRVFQALDRKSTRLNSSHANVSRMPSSA